MKQLINVEQWIAMYREIGLNEGQMKQWHRLFEARHPEAHQGFLTWLGLTLHDIDRIRSESKYPPSAGGGAQCAATLSQAKALERKGAGAGGTFENSPMFPTWGAVAPSPPSVPKERPNPPRPSSAPYTASVRPWSRD